MDQGGRWRDELRRFIEWGNSRQPLDVTNVVAPNPTYRAKAWEERMIRVMTHTREAQHPIDPKIAEAVGVGVAGLGAGRVAAAGSALVTEVACTPGLIAAPLGFVAAEVIGVGVVVLAGAVGFIVGGKAGEKAAESFAHSERTVALMRSERRVRMVDWQGAVPYGDWTIVREWME
jgi:hypothetical protein